MIRASENDDPTETCKENFQRDNFNSEIDVQEKKNRFILKTPHANDTSLTARMQSDPVYKEKVVLSVCLCWAFVTLGWAASQFGPSFLDFQIITRTDVTEASGFLTSRSVGYLAGAVVSGMLFDRFNKVLLAAIFPSAGAVVSAVLPWCFWYELMIAVQFFGGFYGGGIDASGNALLLSIWGQEGHSYVQALHFSFAFGGIMSPLVTSPFLQETFENRNDVNITETGNVSSIRLTDCNSNMSQNTSSMCTSSNVIPNVTTTTGHDYASSRLYVAFSLTAAIHIACAVPLFIMYCRARRCQRGDSTKKTKEVIKRISRKITFRFKVLVLFSLCWFMAIYGALEDTFTAFLTAFCVTQLSWSKVKGSYVTSLYWAVFGFARFLGIWIIKFITPAKIICVLTIALCVDLGALYVFADFRIDEGIWACVVCTGASMSLIYPCVILWTEEKLLPVSGKILSLFMIASSSGTMTNPIILGYLMETFTPMWFAYLLFGESVVLVILFLILIFIARVSETRFGTGNSPDSVTVHKGLTSKENVEENEKYYSC